MKIARKWRKFSSKREKAPINNFFMENENFKVKTAEWVRKISTLEKLFVFTSACSALLLSIHLTKVPEICVGKLRKFLHRCDRWCLEGFWFLLTRLLARLFQPFINIVTESTSWCCTTSSNSSHLSHRDWKGNKFSLCVLFLPPFWTHLNFHLEYKHCQRAFSLDTMAQSPCPDR